MLRDQTCDEIIRIIDEALEAQGGSPLEHAGSPGP